MTSQHDAGVVEQVRRSRASIEVGVDDPAAVARALVEATGGRLVPAADAPAWAAEARSLRVLADRVLAAEEVVAGARAADRARHDELLVLDPAPPVEHGPGTATAPGRSPADEAAADRQALRFSLVILGLAQVAGSAVYVVDGDVLAVAAPATGLLVVAGIVLAHRRPVLRPRTARTSPEPAGPGAPVLDAGRVGGAPAVRAADAHLRRQQAAWKLAWWERGLPPAAVADWTGTDAGAEPPATLVVVDGAAELDEAFHATMTAAVPAAVRVVLVRSREPDLGATS